MTFPELTEQQVNIILTALGQRPYIEVAQLLDTIALHIKGQQLLPPASVNGAEAEKAN